MAMRTDSACPLLKKRGLLSSAHQFFYDLRAGILHASKWSDTNFYLGFNLALLSEVSALEERRFNFVGAEKFSDDFGELLRVVRLRASENVDRDVSKLLVDVQGDMTFGERADNRAVVLVDCLGGQARLTANDALQSVLYLVDAAQPSRVAVV